jgi:hypothetical protein
MGGFVLDISEVDSSRTRVTLTPDAIQHLAELGYFLTLDERSIKDKSKADVVAKCLTSVQVSWFLIQGIGRKATGLPISLLEFHILVHIILALLACMLWIKVSHAEAVKQNFIVTPR